MKRWMEIPKIFVDSNMFGFSSWKQIESFSADEMKGCDLLLYNFDSTLDYIFFAYLFYVFVDV